MSKASRRDILKFAGGAAAGLLFTPAPWRTITGAAIWSETWPGIPKPLRGEIRTRLTNCALCPAGCPVRARCVGSQPFSLAGVAGGLCPLGVVGHHMPYVPNRVTTGPVKEAAEAARRAIAACGPEESVAVLDLRPRRTASWTYRRALARLSQGRYVAEDVPFAVDLAKARTVLSLGVSVLDGWGTPAKVFAAREQFRLIQAETGESRSAALADEWLPIAPGSEAALALAAVGKLSASEAAARTGLPAQRISDVAKELESNRPAVILARQPEVFALNRFLGGVVVRRREPPVPAHWKPAAPVTALRSLRDGSVRLLLIDESGLGERPRWSALEAKLAPGATVIAFGWSPDGFARHANFMLPTAVYPETLEDIPPAFDSPNAEFRLAVPLVSPPDSVVDPAKFVAELAGLPFGDPLRERADAIRADQKPEEFWKKLQDGAGWKDSTEEPFRGFEPDLPAFAIGPAYPPLPLFSKIYRESNLRIMEAQS
jgi:anaerobic selenocysteine-containing dehydrogenase